jgi:hypothetical protein
MDTEVQNSVHPSWAPWTLSSVSHQWRRISISLPQLWSYVGIVDPKSHLKCSLSRLTTQLLRSAEYPLHVSIYYFGHMDPMQSLLSTLFTSIRRWRHLIAITDLPSMFKHLPDVTTPFPRLTSLDCGASSMKIFHNHRLPSLHDLQLRQLASSDVESVCGILQRSGCKLEQLDIIEPTGSSGHAVLNLCKIVPHLQELSIDSIHSYEISQVLIDELARSKTFLPALVRLHIDVYGSHGVPEDPELEKFEKTLRATRPRLEFWWSDPEAEWDSDQAD